MGAPRATPVRLVATAVLLALALSEDPLRERAGDAPAGTLDSAHASPTDASVTEAHPSVPLAPVVVLSASAGARRRRARLTGEAAAKPVAFATSVECRPMAELDPEVGELLGRWAASPVRPVSELTAEAVREDELAVLDLQRAPGELY